MLEHVHTRFSVVGLWVFLFESVLSKREGVAIRVYRGHSCSGACFSGGWPPPPDYAQPSCTSVSGESPEEATLEATGEATLEATCTLS